MVKLPRELYLLVLSVLRAYRASLGHNEEAQWHVAVIIAEFEKVYR